MKESVNVDTQSNSDGIEVVLKTISQTLFLATFGLLPILFIPSQYVSLSASKTLLACLAVLTSIIFLSLSILRSGIIRTSSLSLVASMWLVSGVAVISSLVSGDVLDSFIGNAFDTQSSLLLLLMAGVVTLLTMMGHSKTFLMRIYVLLTASAIVLGLFHISRLFLGPTFLSFGLFTSQTSSFLGGWNDIAVFFGLCILLALLALDQLPLTKFGKILFSSVVGIALVLLATVNFLVVWFIIALVSLVVMMYNLTKDRFSDVAALETVSKKTVSLYPLVVSIVVFVVSLVFIIGGSVVGDAVRSVTGIEYTEVRPSVSATLDIARSVYSDNALLGIGPNKFNDAWRLHKDQSLNETIFWAIDFKSGNGFLPTHLATDGLLGLVTWLVFFSVLLWSGAKNLFRSEHRDRFWFFITTSSFIAALYLWGITFVYNPTTVLLLLAALFTGVYATAVSGIYKPHEKKVTFAVDRRTGLVLVLFTMCAIIGASSALYYIGRHYVATYTFAKAVVNSDQVELETTETRIRNAFALVQNDLFARQIADYQIIKMRSLLSVEEPTAEQQQVFQVAVDSGIAAANTAVTLDETEPGNWAVLGNVYSLLAAAGVEGSSQRALEAYATAQKYDPLNPLYVLFIAQVYAQSGDAAQAEAEIEKALALKSNYIEALYLLSQIKVDTGAVAEAVTSAQAMARFEPRNPGVFYYLGILASSDNQVQTAISAFKRAIEINPQFANARYLLALTYIKEGEMALAREQLVVVKSLNPNNENVQSLISQIDDGTVTTLDTAPDPVVSVDEAESSVSTDGDAITVDADPETDLIVPINPLPSTNEDDEVTEERATQ